MPPSPAVCGAVLTRPPAASFKQIDPTHCHASAHPQEADGTIAFAIQDKAAGGDESGSGDGAPAGEAAGPSTVSVSEVATRYLRRLVGSASDYLGKKVTSAVIAVPTDFSDRQRAALVAAAAAAGVEVLQLISEPVAAVLAYDARPEAEVADKMVVVADLGGTRSDVAVVASRGGMYTVLATVHDYEFAGAALDKVLADHFAKEFVKRHAGASDPRDAPRSLAKLRLEAEATKKAPQPGAATHPSASTRWPTGSTSPAPSTGCATRPSPAPCSTASAAWSSRPCARPASTCSTSTRSSCRAAPPTRPA